MSFDPELGPLALLRGTWEGDKGSDLAPSDEAAEDRQPKTSLFRERMVFEPTGRVDNHEQHLYGLRYSTRAWRLGAEGAFHEELGYWMYEPSTGLVLRSFMPPRGMTILAGGHAEASAHGFSLEANAGDEVFGICSSPFLASEFKTVRYTVRVDVTGDGELRYESHTFLRMKGRDELFDHVDKNVLRRVG